MNSRGVILTVAALALGTGCDLFSAAAPAGEPRAEVTGAAVEASFKRSKPERSADLYLDTLTAAGGHHAALSALNDAVHSTPRAAAAWRALAQLHLDPDAPTELRDPQAAIEAAIKAIDYLDQPDAAYFVTLGTAYFVHGDVAAAITAYARALDANAAGDGQLEHPEELEELLRELRSDGR